MPAHNWTMGLLWLLGFMVTFSAIPLARRVALRYGMVSAPGGRKLHGEPTPLLGGIAIYLPFAVVFILFFVLYLVGEIQLDKPSWPQMISLFIGVTWILVLGTLDDKHDLGWRKKLLGQTIGAVILCLGGHSIAIATLPVVGPVDFGWFGIPFFIAAVICVTNAINLVDGLDGLAGGICFFAAMASGIIGLAKGDYFAATIGFTVSGSLVGFLLYNFPPASIFMGDGGAMMLGFLLGTLATSCGAAFPGQRLGTTAMILIPFLPFGIPLFEVALSVLRRWLRGQAIFLGDGDHLHYRVTGKIRNPRLTVAIFYFFSAALCALTVILVLGFDSDFVRVLAAMMAFGLVAGGVASIRLYRLDTFFTTLRHRPHFTFLGKYLRYMKHRIRKARSMDELLALLESGVRDLDFDSVTVLYDGGTVEKWTNHLRIHPGNLRVHAEREFCGGRLIVRWVRPVHDDEAYNEYLMLTWYRFMVALEVEVSRHEDDLLGRDKDSVVTPF